MKNKLRFLLLLVITIFTFALASCGADGVPNDNFGGSAENNDNNVVVETTRKIYYTANYKKLRTGTGRRKHNRIC